MKPNETVINLLNKLKLTNPYLTWKMRCLYSDGRENTFIEITIQEGDQKTRGKIVYSFETGKVVRYRYTRFGKKQGDEITDVLLDLINYEQQHGVVKEIS